MASTSASLSDLAAIDAACDRFEGAWREAQKTGGIPPDPTAFLAELAPEVREMAQPELEALDAAYRHPAQAVPLADQPTIAAPPQPPTPQHPAPPSDHALRLRCPQCQGRVDLSADAPLDDITCLACGSTFGLVGESASVEAFAPQVGRFQLRQRIGMGGFGAVWRARDPELDRDVALKLPRRGGLNPHEAELFFREARAAAQLAHPGIVSVYEVGRDAEAGGSIYIVSELIDGPSLAERLKKWTPTPREAAAVIADVAEALHFAHERGVIHRDLKPSNILLDRFSSGGETSRIAGAEVGRPRLMDFGLAKRDAVDHTLTLDGQVLGTPAYMSPEQASGRVRWVDRRTDVYSLGVMLFRLLTGDLPFRGTAASQIQQRLVDDAPSPRRLDPTAPLDLATVCLKCLERDPARRYATAEQVAAEMRRYLAGEPVHARPLSAAGRAGRWALRHPALATAVALGAVLAIVGPTAAVVIGRQATRLEAQLRERDELIARQEQQVDQRETAEDQSARPAAALKIDGVHLAAVNRLLERDNGKLVAQAKQDPEDATRRYSVARLLVAAGRYDEAASLLDNITTGVATPAVDALRQALEAARKTRDAAATGSLKAKPSTVSTLAPPPLPEGDLSAEELEALVDVLVTPSN